METRVRGRDPLSDVLASYVTTLTYDPKRIEAVVGKEWSKLPLGSLMEILSKRFNTRSFDSSDLKAFSVLRDLIEFSSDLSDTQIKFLLDHDHLPRSGDTQRLWLDGPELLEYQEQNLPALEARKMEHFVMANGLIQAAASVKEVRTKSEKPKKIKSFYVLIGAIVVILLATLFILQ